jgi:hypothetical protein
LWRDLHITAALVVLKSWQVQQIMQKLDHTFSEVNLCTLQSKSTHNEHRSKMISAAPFQCTCTLPSLACVCKPETPNISNEEYAKTRLKG